MAAPKAAACALPKVFLETSEASFCFITMQQFLFEGLLQSAPAILHDSMADRVLLHYHAKRSVEQVGLSVDRESVTSPAPQVMVPCDTAMCKDGMGSSTRPFFDASDPMAVNREVTSM